MKSEVNKALKNVSFKDIDTLNIDENKTKLKIQKVIADIKAVVEKNPISVGINIESKKNKLDNDLTTYLNKYTKIKESSVLLEEANKVRDLIDAINDKKSLREATDAFQLYKSSIASVGYNTQSTIDKIKSMLSHITKIGSAFGVASMLINNFTKSLKTLRENDTILTEISKTSEMTKNQLKELGDEAFKIASKYGQLSSNFLLATQEMARAGYDDNVKDMAELSTKAQGAGDMTAKLSNQYIIATDKAFKMNGSIEMLTATLDGANNITNNNALAMTDLAEAMSIVGSQAASAGMEVNETTAAVATMIAVTQRSGSEAANALKGIIMNLQQVTGDVGDGEDIIDTESLSKYEKACAELGVSLSTVKDGIVSLKEPMQIIKELAEAYTQLDESDARRANLLSAVGGKYRANMLNAILENYDLYEKMLKEYADGLGSMDAEAEKTAKSWEGRLNALQNSWDSLVSSLTNKEAIMGGVSLLDRLIQGAESLTDSIGEIPVVLTTVNSALVAMNKDYGISQLVNPETKKLDIQGNLLGIDFTNIKNFKKHLEEAEEVIGKWNIELSTGQINIDDFGEALVKNNAQFKAYLQTTSKDAPASLSGYKAYLNAAGISTDALRLKTILLNSAISMGIGVAIQLAVKGITYLIQREEKLRQATEEAANAYKDSASSIDDYASRYQELHKALIAARGNEEETYNIKKQLLELQTELNDRFGDEYGAINLVTEAYKDQTEAIKALNKETAQTFLNENKEGIDKSEKEMTKNRHYNLSYTGLIGNTDKGEALKELAEKYKEQGITLLDEYGDGDYLQFSIHLDADAQSAYETINAFENDLRDKAKELGDEHMFDDVLDVSSDSLNKAKETIEKYGDTYRQALTAEIASDDDRSKTYGEALKAVEAYNEAVLRSENPYDDQNVVQAKEDLDAIKTSIQDNEAEWGKYSILFDDVFGQADTRLLEFDEALKADSGLKEFAENLEGLSDIDLQALGENIGENDSFDKLKEAAAGYKVNVDELIGALVRLGYVQGEIQSTISDTTESIAPTISSSIQQIATQLEPQFAKLGDAYREIFKVDDNGKEIFSLDSIDNSMLEELRQAFAEIKDEVGVTFDASKLDSFFDTLTNGNSTAEQVQQAFNDLATAYLYSTDTLEQLNSETANAIEKQLEELGVQNAAEIVADELTAKTEELIVAKEYLAQTGQELASATDDEVTAFILEQIEAGNCGEALALLQLKKMLVNGTLLDTTADINNVLALAQAAGITSDALTRLASLKAAFDNAQASGNYGAMNAISAEMEKTKSQVETDIANFKPVEIQFDSASAAKSAKKAGSSAGDAYVDAFEKELKRLQTLRDQGKITEKQYLDYLRKLYQKFYKDKKKYAEQYAKYEHEYLQGMKSLYESALSGITSMLNKQISAYGDAKSEAVESLEAQRDAAIEAKEAEKERYEQEIELIDKQIAAKEKAIKGIQDEIDAMRTANEQKKQAINLQQDEYNLQRMLNQRTKQVYKDGQFVFETDTSGVREAKQKVEDDKLEIAISNKEKEIKLIEKEIDLLNDKKDAINEQIDLIDKQIDQINDYYDKLISDTEKYWDDLIKGMEDYKSRWEELAELEEQAKLISMLEQLGITTDDVLNMSEEAFARFKDEYIGILADIYSGNDSMLSALSDTTGRSVDEMGSYITATQGYIDSLSGIGESLDPLSEAIGNVDENMGSLSSTTSEANENLTDTVSKTDTVATNVGNLNTNLSEATALVTEEQTAFNNLKTKIDEVIEAINLKTEAIEAEQKAVETATSSEMADFLLLKEKILEVKETLESLGTQDEGLIYNIATAIESLNEISLEDGIIGQFTQLKEAVDAVASAISGGGGESSGSESQGGNSGSSGGESGGKGSKGEGGGGNSLTGAIEQMGETANTVIGEPDAEGDGTVIGEFGSLETAVNDVTTAIGGGESEGGSSGEEESDNLIGSIVNLGETSEETLGEPDGDGIIGKFNEFKGVIEEAANQVRSISEGLDEIDGKEVECTITVNVKMNGSIPAFASGTVLGNMQIESASYNAKYGKAFASGTIGLPHAEKNALVSEYGQTEMTVLPDGKTIITDTPTMMDLPKDTVIFNEKETKKIMDNKVDVSGTAHADGTAHVNGTVTDDAPHYPSQEILDFTKRMKKLEMQHELIANYTYGVLSPLHEIKQNTENMISNISNVNNVNNKIQQPVNVQIGDINLTGVQDVNGLAQAIKTRLPGQMMQEYFKN